MNKVFSILAILFAFCDGNILSNNYLFDDISEEKLNYNDFVQACKPSLVLIKDSLKNFLINKNYFNEEFWLTKTNDGKCMTMSIDKVSNSEIDEIKDCNELHRYVCFGTEEMSVIRNLLQEKIKMKEEISSLQDTIKNDINKNKIKENKIKEQFLILYGKLSDFNQYFISANQNITQEIEKIESEITDFFQWKEVLKKLERFYEKNSNLLQEIIDKSKNYAVLPTINISNNKSEYDEGEELYIECNAEGNPTPNITWIRLDKHGKINQINDKALHIFDINRNHSGIYQCVADNNIGNSKEAIISINVIYKPILTATKQSIAFVPHSIIKIKCQIHSNPDISNNYWILNNNQTQNSSLFLSKENSMMLTLNTTNEIEKFVGDYFCCAENIKGETCTVIKLYEEPPYNITLKIVSTEIPSEAKLIIIAYSKTPIQKTRITYKSIKSIFWKDITIQDFNNRTRYNFRKESDNLYVIETIIDDLIPTDVYQFKIKLYNNYASKWVPSEPYIHQNAYICNYEIIYANIKPLYLISHPEDKNDEDIEKCEARIISFSSMGNNIEFSLLSNSDNINVINRNLTKSYTLEEGNNLILPNLYVYDINYLPPEFPKGFKLRFQTIND